MRDILKGIPDKRQDKNTTSLKFKKDLIEFFGEDYKDKICLEIGTSKGYSTRLLSFLFKKVITCEINPDLITFAKNINKDRENIEFLQKDVYGTRWDFEDIDVVFIDCDHEISAVLRDIQNAISLCKPSQELLIVFDDYGLDTLFLFVDDSSVDSIIIGETYERTELARDDSYDEDDTEFLFYWNTADYTDSTWYDIYIQAKDASNNIGYSDTISLYLDTIDNPLSNHRLVYTTEDGMHVINADGENYIKISDDLAIELLSTDDKIIYTSSTEFGQAEIYSINFDGTDRTRLTFTTYDEENISLKFVCVSTSLLWKIIISSLDLSISLYISPVTMQSILL